jgi:hypothetical protein
MMSDCKRPTVRDESASSNFSPAVAEPAPSAALVIVWKPSSSRIRDETSTPLR